MTNAPFRVRKLLYQQHQAFRLAVQGIARMETAERYSNGTNLPEIVYKSKNYLCVNKGYDIKINFNDPEVITLETQLRNMFPELVDPNVGHSFRYVHRLDHATSGIICLALNKNAAKHLHYQFRHKRVVKYYMALVRGHVEEDCMFIDVPTGDLPNEDLPRRCAVTDPACLDPRDTQTLLICLERGSFDGKPATKVVLKPITGRQHQLRVHCDFIGHTIVGDFTYSLRQDTDPERMMLHSYRLIAKPEIEDLDLITADPFTPDIVTKWVPEEIVHTYEEAERLGDVFDPLACDIKTVKINQPGT